jgi:hypothetical protein
MEDLKCKTCRHLSGSITRRDFFSQVSDGIYGAALALLLSRDLYGGSDNLAGLATDHSDLSHQRVYDLKPRSPHFPPKAKAVIQLLMAGAPSQMDLFDPKPMLEKHAGEMPDDVASLRATENRGLLPSPFKFAQHGKSGTWLSEAMPHLANVVDEIAVIRSMQSKSPIHALGLYMLQSGRIQPGFPAMGAWMAYGLGSMNQNLPAFVVLDDPLGLPTGGVENWTSGFLPPIYQGTRLRADGAAVLDLQPGSDDAPEMVKLGRDLLNRLDRIHKRENYGQPLIDARIADYELAARMQLAASAAMDLSEESKETLEMYGVGQKPAVKARFYANPGPSNYARRCIMARRLVERGVRFVQICVNSQIWDQHGALEQDLRAACDRTDKPVAALIKDLKQRGLLDSTLVVWAGEFGRLPIGQLDRSELHAAEGRDHNVKAFSAWFAGGGIKGGTVYGATDDFGNAAAENPVSIADLHATILHQLGLDYKKLFYEVDGKQETLTANVEARVVKEILT